MTRIDYIKIVSVTIALSAVIAAIAAGVFKWMAMASFTALWALFFTPPFLLIAWAAWPDEPKPVEPRKEIS